MRKIIKFVFLSTYLTAGIAFADDEVSLALEHSEKWLMPAKECPADVIGAPKEVLYENGLCSGRIDECLSSCMNGSAKVCYNLALELQATKKKEYEKYSEALFLQSCKLGGLSGCTNRAAGIEAGVGERLQKTCSIKTYENICKLGDPWSCTMFGLHLVTGDGVKKNFVKAKLVMESSCKYGKDDPACAYAQALFKKMDSTETLLPNRQ